MSARLARAGVALLAVGLIVAAVPKARARVLQTVGALLVAGDPVAPVDYVAMTESGDGGEADLLDVSDLFRKGVASHVLLLMPTPTAADRELSRRGVVHDDIMLAALVQLGVPRTAITTLDAGEGGTTESTQALAAWAADHPSRVLVVVSPSHARRYRRTLRRVWPRNAPAPRVSYPLANPFHAGDWWVSRRTRRDGLFELQKLAWDYLRHPW